MSLSSIPFDHILFAATASAATATYYAGVMGIQFNGLNSALSRDHSADLQPARAIGMRRAGAFQERLDQRPRESIRRSNPCLSFSHR